MAVPSISGVGNWLSSATGKRMIALTLFYLTLGLLFSTVAGTYITRSEVHQSAYGEDWNDMSAFRADIKNQGITTTSIVSSPLLLEEIQSPRDTVFVVSGIERDTISLPRFSADSSVIQLVEGLGYSTSEIEAISSFVERGGTIVVLDDFGYAQGLADEFGLGYSGHQLYDTQTWDPDLDFNYVWLNITNGFNYSSSSGSRTNTNPCIADQDSDGTPDFLEGIVVPTTEELGLCSHRWDSINGNYNMNPGYDLLLNQPSAFDKGQAGENADDNLYPIGFSTQDAYLDTNNDGKLTVGFSGTEAGSDEQGPFAMYVKYCRSRNCDNPDSGRAYFVTDGSLLVNSIYDTEGVESGVYGEFNKTPDINDNRRWALDLIAEALMSNDGNATISPDAQVIFDESRHQQPSFMGDTYNLLYYILIYFTNDWMAMLLMFLGLFVLFEFIIIKKLDPEPWRHVFSIIYYGYGDSRRYEYYGRANKIKQILLTRVRNVNSLTREEFDALPARDLQKMVNDPVLIKFIFEDRRYSMEEIIAVIKRIKTWGRR
ncbi:MAG: DUF4350 domain-containing protein [Candidatus Thermoplasmatota archaeon]|nr:DUF4350 domain-containing protein [Candidatus Thermoplasmatota archaeon]